MTTQIGYAFVILTLHWPPNTGHADPRTRDLYVAVDQLAAFRGAQLGVDFVGSEIVLKGSANAGDRRFTVNESPAEIVKRMREAFEAIQGQR